MYYFQQTTLLHSSCKELNMDSLGILFQNNKNIKQNKTPPKLKLQFQNKLNLQ